MVDLINEADQVDGQGRATSLECLREQLEQPDRYPALDLFLAEGDGALVGYIDISRELEIGRVLFDGAVHPASRRRGIGTRLLERAISHARKLGAPQAHISILEGMYPAQQLAHKAGFAIVRRHWRMRLWPKSEAVQLPPGVALQHFVPGDEEKLTRIQNLAFAGSWGFKPNKAHEISYRVCMSLCRQEGIIFATVGQEVIGYCWTRINAEYNRRYGRSCGEVYMMGVHPDHRGRGVGRGVLLAGIDYLRRQGMTEVMLTVDSENTSACRLYQEVGFQKIGDLLWYGKALS